MKDLTERRFSCTCSWLHAWSFCWWLPSSSWEPLAECQPQRRSQPASKKWRWAPKVPVTWITTGSPRKLLVTSTGHQNGHHVSHRGHDDLSEALDQARSSQASKGQRPSPLTFVRSTTSHRSPLSHHCVFCHRYLCRVLEAVVSSHSGCGDGGWIRFQSAHSFYCIQNEFFGAGIGWTASL